MGGYGREGGKGTEGEGERGRKGVGGRERWWENCRHSKFHTFSPQNQGFNYHCLRFINENFYVSK